MLTWPLIVAMLISISSLFPQLLRMGIMIPQGRVCLLSEVDVKIIAQYVVAGKYSL